MLPVFTGYKSVTLTGKVTGKDRMDVVDAFQNHKDCFIFFISQSACPNLIYGTFPDVIMV